MQVQDAHTSILEIPDKGGNHMQMSHTGSLCQR